ncbi:MAG: DUF460 domain-containing protein [Candidatus Altiarchaeales archaeon]|nr:DUF460 domain-containing protein [Candidatus Altiarchaeales archaeon]MBD3416541.1 DUF460 domain-containing protein [Candidatus Altiarchaeales archaeon]
MSRHLIVGVDPGTTSGVSLLDLGGELVEVHSSKDMGLSRILNHIIRFGSPSLVACDVNPAPEMVSKVASNLGVRMYVPEKDLSVSEKQALTSDYELSDSHQRDSLAAALYAYGKHRNKLEKIDSLGLGDRVKHFVLQGNSISRAKKAFAPVEEVKGEKPKPERAKTPSPEERRIRSLERRVKALKGEILERDSLLDELKAELNKSKGSRRVVHVRDSNVEKRIGSLKTQIRDLKKYRALLKKISQGDVVPVGVYPHVLAGLTLIENRPDSLEGVEVAFTSKKRIVELLHDSDIPSYESGELEELGGFRYITAKRLHELSETGSSVEDIITEYRKKRK